MALKLVLSGGVTMIEGDTSLRFLSDHGIVLRAEWSYRQVRASAILQRPGLEKPCFISGRGFQCVTLKSINSGDHRHVFSKLGKFFLT